MGAGASVKHGKDEDKNVSRRTSYSRQLDRLVENKEEVSVILKVVKTSMVKKIASGI